MATENEKEQRDSLLLLQTEQIAERDRKIHDLTLKAQSKDSHIHEIESELDLIRQSKAWRLAEFFRRLIYIKLFGNKFLRVNNRERSDYEKWIAENEAAESRISDIQQSISQFDVFPKISIILAGCHTDQNGLERTVASVINQHYEKWELCIVLGGSACGRMKMALSRYDKLDKKLCVKYLPGKEDTADLLNESLALSTGEYVLLFKWGDRLSPDALYEIVMALRGRKGDSFLYSDEDKIASDGRRFDPFFKPDWSPDTLRSYNYIRYFAVMSRELIISAGGFRQGFDGAHYYDIFLRASERAENIIHIPKVLYHRWRDEKVPEDFCFISDPVNLNAKKALSDHIRRLGWEGEICDGLFHNSYRIHYRINDHPEISIIIPTRDNAQLTRKCIDSIFHRTSYPNYSVVIVDNGSVDETTADYLGFIGKNPRVTVMAYNRSFNYSSIINYAISEIDSEYFVLLNNDTEVISSRWIESMLEHAQRKEVGAVGALLYYPSDKVQHGGVLLGVVNVAGHSHRYFDRYSLGYNGRLKVVQNLSAVTAACLMSTKTIFREVEGFDEKFSHSFNDVDYCLKLREAGYLVIYTPYAELLHHEYMSRGNYETEESQARLHEENERFKKKWKVFLDKGDPYYNPNLTRDKEDFSAQLTV